ncbi:CotH kinase family protein [Paenibacillus radicis (ex Xue et al. 2023)]|uniref:CotH kinase family protein n=1 Tax=Paenibacillus radicis (ex Xue et al. 2023) TaxID=2972489 RepID=A0ABT1YPV2_9BACL|nr:CotH kinase family protein [Paenibacillus radicis (ex Xue et al. 2023)]MCR8634760.1 CotH kinase family protein [Paenibacillus radicis (ex Xue et al. 2023)]
MKTKAAVLLLCICVIFGITGCSLTNSVSTLKTSVKASASVSKNTQNIAEKVFPKDKVVDVKITLDPDDFQDMLDNASNEEFKTASVDYNGQHFDNIAVRTKGNLSLRSVVSSDSDRYSFKIAFDEYISSQTLYGISKINLNNNYSDASYMREFLTYELAEEMGLPTPAYSFVNVYINGELKGFYLAVEQIGEEYLERNFGNAYGALYKANGGTGSELNWLEDIDAYTGLDLKSKSANNNVLLDMVDELNNGTHYEEVLDVDEALKFIALNVLTGNMDSYLGNNKHNYYLYEDDGKFAVLPWDYNMAFGGLGGSGLLIDEPTQGTLADRPLINKLLKVDAYKEKYHEIIEEAIDGYLSNEAFSARVKELSDMISTYVEKDPTAFYTYAQYQQALPQLTSFTSTQVSSFANQLDGTSPSSGDGSGSGGGMGGGGRGGMQGQGGKQNGRVQALAAPAAAQQGQAGQAAAQQGQAGQAAAQQGQAGQAAAQQGQAGQAAAQQGQAGQVAAQQGQAGQAAAQQGQAGQAAAQQGQAGQSAAQQGQAGQSAAQQGQAGQMPVRQGGPGGQGGLGGPGGAPGGFGGGPGGPAAQKGSATEAIASGVALIVLILGCLVIVFYKRNRL